MKINLIKINVNSQAQENMDSMMEQIQEINDKLKKLREETNRINKQFETIKMKRFNLFSECLDCVTTEIDSIYKVSIFGWIFFAIPFVQKMTYVLRFLNSM